MTVTIDISDNIETCLAIRHTVFVEEQGIDLAEEIDGLDPEATHVLATADGEAVGTARILFKNGDAKVGRVAVLPSHRGGGLGADIIRKTIAVARDTPGVTRVVLGAQTHALGFYRQLGFQSFGPIYDDAGIPHQDMELHL